MKPMVAQATGHQHPVWNVLYEANGSPGYRTSTPCMKCVVCKIPKHISSRAGVFFFHLLPQNSSGLALI